MLLFTYFLLILDRVAALLVVPQEIMGPRGELRSNLYLFELHRWNQVSSSPWHGPSYDS